jgi:type IV secretory pathway protease TraF
MMRRTALSAAAVAALLAPAARPRLLWNTTASAPIGLYRVAPEWPAARGTLVAVRPPAAMAIWLDSRGYAPAGAVLIKRVAALWPSTVCRAGAVVTVDGEPVGLAIARGRRGETLPRWSGCRRLRPDEVFLLNAAPGSLDGRYFGPLPRAAILGRAVPLAAEMGQ